MILNINQNDYIAATGESAGARLVIHHQSRMPFPEDDGITLQPGALTSVGLRHVRIHVPACKQTTVTWKVSSYCWWHSHTRLNTGHVTLPQCCFNVRPASKTMYRYKSNNGTTVRVCWEHTLVFVPMLVYCWDSAVDVGPTLSEPCVNIYLTLPLPISHLCLKLCAPPNQIKLLKEHIPLWIIFCCVFWASYAVHKYS